MYDGALADLIDQFGQLPGIGPKSAQRMAMHVLDAEPEDVARLVDAINAAAWASASTATSAAISTEVWNRRAPYCRDVRRDPQQ